jgi:isopentenyl-diphosphate delta-isomerase
VSDEHQHGEQVGPATPAGAIGTRQRAKDDGGARDARGPVEARKAEHLRLTATADVTAATGAGWADVHLLHQAVPAIDLDGIDLRVDFLGRRLEAPLFISGMTGGHASAAEVNATLARAAERHGLGMGVGSQRAAARSPALADTGQC